MTRAVVGDGVEQTVPLARRSPAQILATPGVIDQDLVTGIERVGDVLVKGELFLPKWVQGAEATKSAVAVLQLEPDRSESPHRPFGVAVAATLAGDLRGPAIRSSAHVPSGCLHGHGCPL
jgi:cobalamin-dependent methionine synthase I